MKGGDEMENLKSVIIELTTEYAKSMKKSVERGGSASLSNETKNLHDLVVVIGRLEKLCNGENFVSDVMQY